MTVTPSADPPDSSTLPWYGTDQSLPAARFIPGMFPHPSRNPEGERKNPEIHRPWTPEQWPTLRAYLRGIDLFNRWYFWEAHEAWETLWRAHPPQSEPARFVQGLIGTAAALLKIRMGNPRAARTLSQAAGERLASFQGIWMGLEVERFRSELARYFATVDTGSPPVLGADTPRIRLEKTTRTP